MSTYAGTATAFQQYMLKLNTGLDHSDDTQPATDAELYALGRTPGKRSCLPWYYQDCQVYMPSISMLVCVGAYVALMYVMLLCSMPLYTMYCVCSTVV